MRYQDCGILCWSDFVADSTMKRNDELDLLQSAELKQAFDEFDKVQKNSDKGHLPRYIFCKTLKKKNKVKYWNSGQWPTD